MNENGKRVFEELEPTEERCSQYLAKILQSSALGGSEISRNLLAYLAKQAVHHPGQPVKEFEIATQVLGRNGEFDPRFDSSVRVQTARLRSKLAEYYVSEGAEDGVVIEIPKGAYRLHYRSRAPKPPLAPQTPAVPGTQRSNGRWWIAGLSVAGVLILGWAVFSERASSTPPALLAFWRPFIESPAGPLVIYSNADFVGSAFTGFRYFREGVDKREGVVDVYTGIGEVMAVHDLTSHFLQFRKPIRVVRGRLLTWDQAKDKNLIFLGSPEENLSTRELPKLQEFNFKERDAEPRPGVGAVINEHPRPGEERFYFTSGAAPFTSDYAVIAYVPGLQPQHRTLILAGATTHGTQAAAEFVCQPESLAELLSKLEVPNGAPLPYFEALIAVQISGGVPVRPKLVLTRVRNR